MRRIAAATILLAGMALSGVHAAGVSPETALQVPPELVSPYQQYDLRLRTFSPAPRHPAGVLLSVRINGGRPLRLVLDSGADLIVIGSKAARAAGLSPGSELDLVGLDSRPAKVGQAATVEIGPVAFRNCRVAFVKGKVIEGADGVIPLSLFSGFLVRLNLPEETLDLIPYARNVDPRYPARARCHKTPSASRCDSIKRKAKRVPGPGYRSVLQRHLSRVGTHSGRISHAPGGAPGSGDGRRNRPAHLSLGAFRDCGPGCRSRRSCGLGPFQFKPPLSAWKSLGVLGFPDLSNYVLTIDYAGGQVRMEPHARSWARNLQSDENSDLPAGVK